MSGEPDLEKLYRSHFGKVVGYFRRQGVADSQARDLAQDTFIKALNGLPEYRGQAKLSTWLWTIAQRVLIDHVRKPATRHEAANDAPVDPDTLSSGASVRQSEMSDCLRRGFTAFAKEHPERAHVLYLLAVEGWTPEQLAELLGRSRQATIEYVSQCRKKLQPYVEGCDDGC